MGILLITVILGLLMYLAYRGIAILLLAPLLAALAAVTGGLPGLAAYTQIFMPATGGFIVTYFPLFLLGAIFGKLMEVSGNARAIGDAAVALLGQKRAILAVMLACAALTYGGVSLFVVAFAVYPVARAVFRAADLPARLIPGTIALGAFTFTMTALPGTPAIQNAIPMPWFGTTPFAAPWLGMLAAAVMAGFGLLWLNRRAAAAGARGEGFGLPDVPHLPEERAIREGADDEGFDLRELGPGPGAPAPALPRPGLAIALAPIVLVVVANFIFSKLIFPHRDLGWLAADLWGHARPADVTGVWSIILSLILACLLVLLLSWRQGRGLIVALSDGAQASVTPIFNTASLVGFGAVIAALPAFAALRDAILGIAPGNPLISLSIAVNVLAGITGSASGGMSIALEALGARYLELSQAAGISPEVLHRVTAVATGGLDALPHNGAVVTLLSICGMSHRQSYLDILMVAVVGPLLSLVVIVLAAGA